MAEVEEVVQATMLEEKGSIFLLLLVWIIDRLLKGYYNGGLDGRRRFDVLHVLAWAVVVLPLSTYELMISSAALITRGQS